MRTAPERTRHFLKPGSLLSQSHRGAYVPIIRFSGSAHSLVVLAIFGITQAVPAGPPTTIGPSSMYAGPPLLTGTIYAKDTNPRQPLFKFKRVATSSGDNVNVLRTFTDLEGEPAARELVAYKGDHLVSYQLEELQIGAAGSARLQREPGNSVKGAIAFEYTKDLHGSGKTRASNESLRPDTLVGDMVGEFLSSHWNDLARGDKVRCRYIVVPRRETVGFTFVKHSETTAGGRPVLIVRMEATSPIIATLVDPLYFTIEKDSPHRVAQYVGRVTPKLKRGDKWDDLDGIFVFDWPK